MDINVDVAIIGAGTSGLNALSQVKRARKSFVLINGGPLGTTCARVGCMPSKAFIQVAEDYHRREVFERHGIQGEEALGFDMEQAMEHVRDLRDIFVDRVISGTTDNLGEAFIEGYAEFVDPTTLRVGDKTIHASAIIVATGSRPIVPEEWRRFGDRVLTTDEIFEQPGLPERLAVIGLGIIGLELGQALHRLGVAVTGIDQLRSIGHTSDPKVNEAAVATIGKEMPLWLGHPATVEAEGKQLRVSSGENSVLVDKVLVSIGRRPNLDRLGLERLGLSLDSRGVPHYDPHTMQVEDLPIFLAGDITGDRPILHEAGDEGRIAGYNASHSPILAFRRKTPLAITFCDPNIATMGTPWSELEGREDVVAGEMRLGPVGRALIMAKNRGIIRVYADKVSGRLLGAEMIAPRGENLAHLICWAIQQERTVFDLLKMPFYHPVIEEALQAALYDLVTKVEAREAPLLELEVLATEGP